MKNGDIYFNPRNASFRKTERVHYVPNYEVPAKVFQMALKVGEWDEISKAISRCDELLMATMDGDAQKIIIF